MVLLTLYTFSIINFKTYIAFDLTDRENAAVLIDSMTQLVINICKRKVNIEIIRKGETEDQMKLIISSALICTVYKEILKQVNILLNIINIKRNN